MLYFLAFMKRRIHLAVTVALLLGITPAESQTAEELLQSIKQKLDRVNEATWEKNERGVYQNTGCQREGLL